jgi:hypothetical protein
VSGKERLERMCPLRKVNHFERLVKQWQWVVGESDLRHFRAVLSRRDDCNIKQPLVERTRTEAS